MICNLVSRFQKAIQLVLLTTVIARSCKVMQVTCFVVL